MKRKGTRWGIDWTGDDAPEVGALIRHVTTTGKVSYARLLTVREVRTRVPMPAPYVARYRVTVERLSERPRGEAVDFTLHAFPRKPKPKPADPFGPFSPLM